MGGVLPHPMLAIEVPLILQPLPAPPPLVYGLKPTIQFAITRMHQYIQKKWTAPKLILSWITMI